MDEEARQLSGGPCVRSARHGWLAWPGALFLAFLASACARDAQAPSPAETELTVERPNLVVYLIDTLRADHLGCYGYARATSPRIDAFAAEAVRLREARAQSSWTKPAVATILTGLAPPTHKVDRRAHRMRPEIETLAERLRAAGYATAMFTTNPTVTAKFGFDQGFDEFHYLSQPRGRRRGHVDSAEIHEEVVEWLDRQPLGQPFFLVVHTLDPHDPYRPREPFAARLAGGIDASEACCPRPVRLAELSPAGFRARAAESMALYDAEIAQNDESFGRLLDELTTRQLLARSAIVLTADHGEEFFDHGGWKHAHTLFEELLKIPFVLRLPVASPVARVLDGPLDQIDIAPTLLDLAGIAIPPELPGTSWLPWLLGRPGSPAAAEESVAWLEHPSYSMIALQRGDWKWSARHGRVAGDESLTEALLYDLARDPGETESRVESERRRFRELAEGAVAATAAAAAASAGFEAEEEPIDPELDRTLRALGYI